MDSLRILGKTWQVERVYEGPMQTTSFGQSHDTKCLIRIKDGQHPDQEADTLLHEIIHALDFTVYIDLDERQTHALAAGLLAVFRDNPGLAGRLGFVPDEP
jgi:hypothetical protein